jgi:hypothetical protein
MGPRVITATDAGSTIIVDFSVVGIFDRDFVLQRLLRQPNKAVGAFDRVRQLQKAFPE